MRATGVAGAFALGDPQTEPPSYGWPMPGLIVPYAGLSLPPGWLWCDGAIYDAAAYPALFEALTIKTTGDANGSATISNVAIDLRKLGLVGGYVIVTANFGLSTSYKHDSITSITSTTIVLSTALAFTKTGAFLRIMPGAFSLGIDGGGNFVSINFSVPDLRGRVLAGRGDMGGIAANRVTPTGTGAPTADESKLGSAGAGGVDRHTLTQAQLPAADLSPAGTWLKSTGGTFPLTAGGGTRAFDPIVIALGGSGHAHPIVQPTLFCNYIIFAGA